MGRKALLVAVLALFVPGAVLGQHVWIGPQFGGMMHMKGGTTSYGWLAGGDLLLTLPVIPLDFQLSGGYFQASKEDEGGDYKGPFVDLTAKYNLLKGIPLVNVQMGLGGGLQFWSVDAGVVGEEDGTYPDAHAVLGLGVGISKIAVFLEPKYSIIFTEDMTHSISGALVIVYKLL